MRWLGVLLLAGCFPYRELWRPAIEGVVVDRDQRPIANARVEACSASKWNPRKCRVRASVVTDGEARFRLEPQREWEWCCLGEAPMPFTVLAACTGSGVGAVRADGREVRITVGAPASNTERDWAARACSGRE